MARYLVLCLFAVPVLRLALPLWRALGLSGTWINGVLGFWERWLTRWRELVAVIWAVWLVATLGMRAVSVWGPLIGLIVLARWQRDRLEWASGDLLLGRGFPTARDHFLAGNQVYGPAGRAAEPMPTHQRAAAYDLRGGRTGRMRLAFLHVFFASAWMTRSAMRAGKAGGDDFLFREIDRGMRLWGLKVLEISRARLDTEGMEKLDGLPGKRLFVFTHVSQTDFAYGFPALDHFIGTDQEIRLRFIIAKDHFVDNPVIHSWSGIGRLILSVGMVPINRKRSKDAVGSLEAAAAQVASRPIDLAIYPQGTRGRAQYGTDGRLIDVGFYSSGSRARASDPLGHVKKGSAFLALDVALALRERGELLQLVVVGIEGAGRLLPKGSLALEAGVSLTYRIGEIITIRPEDVAGLSKRGPSGRIHEVVKQRATELTARLERAMARACRIDERLGGIWEEMFARPMPASDALCRLFDQALALAPARRAALFDQLRALPETVDEAALAPLFEQLSRI